MPLASLPPSRLIPRYDQGLLLLKHLPWLPNTLRIQWGSFQHSTSSLWPTPPATLPILGAFWPPDLAQIVSSPGSFSPQGLCLTPTHPSFSTPARAPCPHSHSPHWCCPALSLHASEDRLHPQVAEHPSPAPETLQSLRVPFLLPFSSLSPSQGLDVNPWAMLPDAASRWHCGPADLMPQGPSP